MNTETTVEVVGDSFVEVLSDRWGEPLDPNLTQQDKDAVGRLACPVSDCQELGFVARTKDTGVYGVVLEWEVPWGGSDDEYESLMMWGERSDQEIVDAVVEWAQLLSGVARTRGIQHRVCVLEGSADIYGGRLGVHFFIPEQHVDAIPEFARIAGPMYGALAET